MEKSASRSLPVTLFGLTLAAMGLVMTASNLHLIPYEPGFLDFLPFFLLSAALDRLVARRFGKALGLSLVAVLVAWACWSPDFHFAQLTNLWPLALVLLGVAFVVRAFQGNRRVAARGRGENVALLSSLRSAPGEEYHGGSLVAMLGAHHLDLRETPFAEHPAVVHIFVFWGAIEILVPEGCQVNLEAHTILGGGEHKSASHQRHPAPRWGPSLVVRGWVIMGAIEVHS